MGRIFISYRRSISLSSAELIYQSLKKFSDDRVFKDVNNLMPGDEWKESIREEVLDADAILVIIEDDWVDICDEHGNQRLWMENDLVRLEIEMALERRDKPKIIPVLINSTPMPRREELPPSLQSLCNRQAARFIVGSDPEPQIRNIIKNMKRKSRWVEAAVLAFAALLLGFVLGRESLLATIICTIQSTCASLTPTAIVLVVQPTAQPNTLPPMTDVPAIPLPTGIPATDVMPTSLPTFTPSPTYLLNALNPGSIHRMLTIRGFSAGVTSLAVSPDGAWLASGINSSARRKAGVWVLQSSALRTYAQTRADTFGVDVSARETWASDSGAVTSLAFSPTKPLLLIGTFKGEIIQFDLTTNQSLPVRTIPSSKAVMELLFMPNNILLAADSGGGFFGWDDQNYPIAVDPACVLSGRGAAHLGFSPTLNVLVAGYGNGDLVFWEWDEAGRNFHCNTQNLNKLNVAGSITSVAFSPNQNILAWGSDKDDRVYLWDMSPGGHPISIPVNDPTNLAFNPDGTLLAVGHNISSEQSGVMQLYDVRNVQSPSFIREWGDFTDRHNETLNGVVFSPDGSFFASGGNADVRLWSIAN